jgi:hypothetical protein
MKLAIAVPTRDYLPAAFAADLAELYAYTTQALGPQSCTLLTMTATYVHDGRERLLQTAEVWGATHILWLDSDMRFPRNAALRLLRHDVTFVGCNYTTRALPSRPTAMRDGTLVPTRPESAGLEEVDSLGFGVLLMHTELVQGVEEPRFRYGWNEESRGTIGEDTSFCRRLAGVGTRMYVDHDLSKEVGHIGMFTYRHDTALRDA